MSAPSHSNALRGAEFKRLIGGGKARVGIGLGAVAGLVVGLLVGGAAIAVAPVAAILVGVGIVFWIADSRAADAFYSAYAENRGLTWQKGARRLDGTSPFLRKGDKQKVNQLFTGPLADGIEGSLALYTYTVESTDSDGNDSDTDYPFTVLTVRMPEVVAHMADLRVQRKSGFKALEGLEDKFRLKHERVTLESEALRDRYEIFVLKGQDPVWVRRLFSPSFIVWLTEQPPKKFAFEMEDGYFVAYIPKHRKSAEALDEMRDISCHVARRLLDEVAETSPAEARA